MTFVSYAQNFEDVLLSRALADVEKGRYLDIGAQDPVVDSVSLAFYERGWRGVHVEPVPAYAAKLREMRPDETVVEAVVTDASGLTTFFEIPETGISTGKRKIAARHSEHGYAARKISVPTVRLDQLLDLLHGDIHWMKIDVEGMEREVLRSWGENDRRPWVLVIEATYPTTQDPTEKAWTAEVLKRGYVPAHFDGLSRYFIHQSHDELKPRFEASVNIFDDFVVSEQHFAASRLREQLAQQHEQIEAEQERTRELEASCAAMDELKALTERQAEQLRDAEQARANAEQVRAEVDRRHAELAEQFVAAERSNAETIARMARERIDAEAHLHWLAGEVQNKLHDEIAAAEARANASQIEVARHEERQKGLEAEVAGLTHGRLELEAELQRMRQSLSEEASARAEADRLLDERAAALAESERVQEQLHVEIASLSAERIRVEHLVRTALAERPDFWQRLGRRLGFSKSGPGWRTLASWQKTSGTLAGAAQSTAITSEQNDLTKQFPPSAGEPASGSRAANLAELLSLHDSDFVRCAYVTVLGREPDEEGRAYYLDRLRSGRSQLHILAQFRSSREARDHDPGIAGLDRAIRRARWERLPLVGALVRLLTGNQWESPANQVARALVEANARLNRRFAQLEDQLHGVGSTVRSLTLAAPQAGVAGTPAEEPVRIKRTALRQPPIVALAQKIRSEWLAA